MRTTLNIDDEVLAAAKAVAARERKTVGALISALARQALMTAPPTELQVRNGVPLLPLRSCILAVTPALVKHLHGEWS